MPGLLWLLITHVPHHPHRTYADMAGEELFKKYQTLIYLAGSASAEVFADIALCPFEAVKVSMGRAGGCWESMGQRHGRQTYRLSQQGRADERAMMNGGELCAKGLGKPLRHLPGRLRRHSHKL